LIEVALEGEDLALVERGGKIGPAEQTVVGTRVEHHVRQAPVEPEREETPGARCAALSGSRRVAVVAEVEQASLGSSEMLDRSPCVADVEDRSGVGGVGILRRELETVC